jgi:hypothetical protein
MKLLTFAAGLAAGYVLGTRAGRERFQQLTDEARKLSNHPKVSEWQDKAKHLLAGGTQTQSSAPTQGNHLNQANQATAAALPSEPGPDATTVAESVAQPRPRRPRAATPGTITESPA